MSEIKQIIRILNTDIDGNKPIYMALKKVKGIGFNFANVICNVLELDKKRKIGSLLPEEIQKIENLVNSRKGLPSWVLNRRKDNDTGEDLHLTTSKLKLTHEFDIKGLKKIKSFRGLRHAWNLPVRGQRTRDHFRRGKAVGVQKKKIQQAKKGGGKK